MQCSMPAWLRTRPPRRVVCTALLDSGCKSCSSAKCQQVACESASKTDMVMIFGEITTSAKVDYEKVVRDTCREIGFTSKDVGLDADTCKAPARTCVAPCCSTAHANSPAHTGRRCWFT